MEMVFSQAEAYLIVRSIQDNHRCKVLIGRDNSGSLYAINQIKNHRLIEMCTETFSPNFPDFKEHFVYNGKFYIVFDYYEGEHLGKTKLYNPSDALNLCEAVCFGALATDIPADIFCQLILTDSITICESEVKFNKFFSFLEKECSSRTAARKLSDELIIYIESLSFDFVQMKTLEKLLEKLYKESFKDIMELYLFVRSFRESYTPMETPEILKSRVNEIVKTVSGAFQKYLFYAAIVFTLFASLMILKNAINTKSDGDMLINRVGGYSLTERGNINETSFEKNK